MYWNLQDKERLIEAIELAKTNKILENFLKDLLTEKEMATCIKRLKAACLIRDGAPYKQIENITGLSSTTIARISKILANKEGGFYKILHEFTSKNPSYFD